MRILIISDLEGCAGIFHREMQISNPAPQEYARTLRICTREVIAAVEGLRAGGAEEVVIDALHDIDLEMLPPGVQVVRGKPWWDDRLYSAARWDGLAFVGMHGGAHLPDCALGHTFLPSWQIEGTMAAAEGWARQVAPQLAGAAAGEFSTVERAWLNGELVGETGVLMAVAAGYGVPTFCVAGDEDACREAADRVPQVGEVPVKWGLGFRAARMLSPAGAQDAVRAGMESALRRLPDIPAWAAARGPQELVVRYVHEERAERAARHTGARRVDTHTVAATVDDGRAIRQAAFLFARPRDAGDPPTAEER